MTDPLSFPSATPRYSIPQLFVGQTQKEPTVNAAHAVADLLLHPRSKAKPRRLLLSPAKDSAGW
jgi:hypothetical protein